MFKLAGKALSPSFPLASGLFCLHIALTSISANKRPLMAMFGHAGDKRPKGLKFAIIDNGKPPSVSTLFHLCCAVPAEPVTRVFVCLAQGMPDCWAPRCPVSCLRCPRWKRCTEGGLRARAMSGASAPTLLTSWTAAAGPSRRGRRCSYCVSYCHYCCILRVQGAPQIISGGHQGFSALVVLPASSAGCILNTIIVLQKGRLIPQPLCLSKDGCWQCRAYFCVE